MIPWSFCECGLHSAIIWMIIFSRITQVVYFYHFITCVYNMFPYEAVKEYRHKTPTVYAYTFCFMDCTFFHSDYSCMFVQNAIISHQRKINYYLSVKCNYLKDIYWLDQFLFWRMSKQMYVHKPTHAQYYS